MISRSGNRNFFAAHYEFLALGLGVLALLGGGAMFALSCGNDPDEAAAAEARSIERMKPQESGVKSVAMDAFKKSVSDTKAPKTVAEVGEKIESFLASERRVLCKCKHAISGDVKKFPNCPYCGEKQEEEKKIVLDADGDGLPDEWEKRFGLNVNDASDANADQDGDGFTNLEEFVAKTDPTDKNDHPDYLDSVKIVLPLKETKMPITFRKASQIPGGWRVEFRDYTRKNDYGKLGRTITAKVGEKLIDESSKEKTDYGYTIEKYEAKSTKREKKGMKGMFVTVDVSEVTLKRERDGKIITLVLGAKPAAVDVQASLVYERGQVQNLDVVPGQEIDLNGTKYRIVDIQVAGKGAKVIFENVATGKKRTLENLE